MTKLIVAFRNFANAPNKVWLCVFKTDLFLRKNVHHIYYSSFYIKEIAIAFICLVPRRKTFPIPPSLA
jgi:hypothetical protein